MLLPKPLILLYQHNQTKKAQDKIGRDFRRCTAQAFGKLDGYDICIHLYYIYILLYVSSVSMPADVAAVYSVGDLGFA